MANAPSKGTGWVIHNGDLPWSGINSENQKFPLTPPPNHLHISAHPGPLRGAYHDRHETRVGDAVDATASGAQVVAGRDQLRELSSGGQTNGAEAYDEIVWT